MRDQAIQTSVPHEIPVRWIERTWDLEVGAAEARATTDEARVGPAGGSRRTVAYRTARRIAVTSRKRFSQPSRAQRHRR